MCSQQMLPANFPKIIDMFHFAWVALTDKFDVSTTNKGRFHQKGPKFLTVHILKWILIKKSNEKKIP